ncbi:MAG: hypothetical protein QM532_03905 [Cyanobium sp. MAG06]|nr:hypothetical protein [Cyanobium sp. MAG06]
MKDDLFNKRHSLAHILMMAILKYYPEALATIGPVIDNGFYYDIDFTKTKEGKFTENDLSKIENEMKNIINNNLDFKKENITENEARERFANNKYKLELIEMALSSDNPQLTIYKTGDFIDLCEGPHINNTMEIKENSFKLNKIAGAY